VKSSGQTIFAGGDYKGKGSIELYALSQDMDQYQPTTDLANGAPGASRIVTDSYQNRQTAAWAKVLAVAAQGGRLVYAAGDGIVRWVERDGRTLVREWTISDKSADDRLLDETLAAAEHEFAAYRSASHHSKKSSNDGDVIKKLLPLPSPASSLGTAGTGDDGLLFWTGDNKVGLLGYGNHPKFQQADFEKGEATSESIDRRREERAYEMRMRRALERQADEVRFVHGLGLGMRAGQ
jgi:hypothetical protein